MQSFVAQYPLITTTNCKAQAPLFRFVVRLVVKRAVQQINETSGAWC